MNKFTKNNEISPTLENPFEFDTLKRKEEIINLTKLINRLDSPFTLAINGTWGSGKTTFIRMWEAYLKEQKYLTMNYNAWENDSSEFPLLTFFGEIQEQIIEPNEEKLKDVGKAILDSASSVISKGIESSLMSLSGGVVNLNLKDAFKEVKDSLKKAPLEYVKYKKERKEFTDKLVAFSKVASKETPNNCIICFIDELDRCRPTFAIELLENIKHYLNVENYIFIIALDKEQLGISIGSVYGNEMDTEGYLKRFIDTTYNLKLADTRKFTIDIFQKIFDEPFEQPVRDLNERNIFFDMMEIFTRGFKLTLRELEQLIFHLKLINKSIRYHDEFEFYLIPLLLILRSKYYDLYFGYFSKQKMYTEVIDFIKEQIEWELLFKIQHVSTTRSRIYNLLELMQISQECVFR